MKKLALLLTVIAFTGVSAIATEPLLLEPLSPAVLNGTTLPAASVTTTDANGVQVTVQGQEGVEATFTPVSQLNPNMVPQNAAAEGKPVPEKRTPRVRIRTKQRSQGNSYWNAGGKGTKSFF